MFVAPDLLLIYFSAANSHLLTSSRYKYSLRSYTLGLYITFEVGGFLTLVTNDMNMKWRFFFHFEVWKSATDSKADKQNDTSEVNLLHEKVIEVTVKGVEEVNNESNFIDDDDLTNSENLRWSEEEDLIQSVSAKEIELPDAQKQSDPEELHIENENPTSSECNCLGCQQKHNN